MTKQPEKQPLSLIAAIHATVDQAAADRKTQRRLNAPLLSSQPWMQKTRHTNEQHERCSRCGGEKDVTGWCANYCMAD